MEDETRSISIACEWIDLESLSTTPPNPATTMSSPREPLRSVHTSSFADWLAAQGVSVAVSTYQAGKLVFLSAAADGVVNTHFRDFDRPMGIATRGTRLAVGTQMTICEYQDVPAACARLAEPHDACYLPRRFHHTGDVRIHEMAFADDELWFVNTAFSALCTLQHDCSFVPRWRPPFVSELEPADRCHLNGCGLRDGMVRYATAMAETNTGGGWRAVKRDGGVVIDVQTGETVCGGLSLPHSPRWYRDQLWVLESGSGGLGTVDLATGRYQEVVRLDGFTRGLAFAGSFALVGLSQVRESATFNDFPLVERLTPQDRQCGVWLIDLDSGRTAGFVVFEEAVQEIFAVEVLRARNPELINDNDDLLTRCYVLPQESLDDVART